MHTYRRNSLGHVLFAEWREIKESFWRCLQNVTQFCNSHYVTYIVNGTNTEKSVKTSESAISLKRRVER